LSIAPRSFTGTAILSDRFLASAIERHWLLVAAIALNAATNEIYVYDPENVTVIDGATNKTDEHTAAHPEQDATLFQPLQFDALAEVISLADL
jgi:hypothetical protein